MKINSTIKRIIQFIIIGIIFFFLIKTLYKNWLQVRTYTWHFNFNSYGHIYSYGIHLAKNSP